MANVQPAQRISAISLGLTLALLGVACADDPDSATTSSSGTGESSGTGSSTSVTATDSSTTDTTTSTATSTSSEGSSSGTESSGGSSGGTSLDSSGGSEGTSGSDGSSSNGSSSGDTGDTGDTGDPACDCGIGEFCQLPVGQCDGTEGVCVVPPMICLLIYNPVCGCDGMTYSNHCSAAGASVNIAYEGEC